MNENFKKMNERVLAAHRRAFGLQRPRAQGGWACISRSIVKRSGARVSRPALQRPLSRARG